MLGDLKVRKVGQEALINSSQQSGFKVSVNEAVRDNDYWPHGE